MIYARLYKCLDGICESRCIEFIICHSICMTVGNEEIAAGLKAARLAKGLTQKELGCRVGMPQSHISKIESGGVDLQLSSLTELSRALDLEVTLVPRAAVLALKTVLRTVGSSTRPPQVPAYRLKEDDA